MKARAKKLTNFPKRKPFQGQSLKRKEFLAQSNNTSITMRDSHSSFDKFIFRDPVTFKNYPFEQLKGDNLLTRQTTSLTSCLNLQKESLKLKPIEKLDLWKKIQQNRNKILVKGKQKNKKQKQEASQKLSNREGFSDKNFKGNDFRLKTQRLGKTQNYLQDQKKYVSKPFRIHTQTNLTSKKDNRNKLVFQKFIKSKISIDEQLYKVNKKIFRKYLTENKDKQLDFIIISEENNKVCQKRKNIQNLMKVQEHNDHQQRPRFFTKKSYQNIIKNPLLSNGFKKQQRTDKLKFNSVKSKTQTESHQGTAKSISKESPIQISNIKNQAFRGKQPSKQNECWTHRKFSPQQIKELTEQIEEYFSEFSQQIDRQIKMKFRRQIQCNVVAKNKINSDTKNIQ